MSDSWAFLKCGQDGESVPQKPMPAKQIFYCFTISETYTIASAGSKVGTLVRVGTGVGICVGVKLTDAVGVGFDMAGVSVSTTVTVILGTIDLVTDFVEVGAGLVPDAREVAVSVGRERSVDVATGTDVTVDLTKAVDVFVDELTGDGCVVAEGSVEGVSDGTTIVVAVGVAMRAVSAGERLNTP